MENAPTRELILEYLRTHPQTAAAEIARALSTTKANIQYHLQDLLAAGLVDRTPQPVSERRGRPVFSYQLAAHPSDPAYQALLRALLSQLRTGGPEALEAVARALLPADPLPANRTLRINQMITLLNQRGYQARWEVHHTGPRIYFQRCPFGELVKDHPELCQMDLELLRAGTGLNLQQKNFDGRAPCIFLLG